MDLKETLKAGDEITIQIAPFGDYPATTTDGKEITQRFDRDSFQRIIDDWEKNGRKMVRADFDHNSELTDNTIASGWIKDLAIDDEKGLVGTLVVSESGAEALNGLDYRFGSPVFAFDETEHPVSLLSFAFTNRPRLKEMTAVWNMADKASDASEVEEVKENTSEPSEETEGQPDETESISENEDLPNKEKNIMDINELKTILGLPEEATEEDIRNTLTEIMGKLKTLAEEEARLEAERLQKEAEEKEAALAAEAEEIVNECGIEDEEKKAEVVNSYKTNPELVKTVLNALKKAPVKMVVNAEEATKPELTAGDKLLQEYQSLKGGKERVDFLMAHRNMDFLK